MTERPSEITFCMLVDASFSFLKASRIKMFFSRSLPSNQDRDSCNTLYELLITPTVTRCRTIAYLRKIILSCYFHLIFISVLWTWLIVEHRKLTRYLPVHARYTQRRTAPREHRATFYVISSNFCAQRLEQECNQEGSVASVFTFRYKQRMKCDGRTTTIYRNNRWHDNWRNDRFND